MNRVRLYPHLAAWVLILAGTVRAGFDGDPLYERAAAADGTALFAVRPFYSHTQNPGEERWHKDYLWPVYSRKGFKDETYSRFLFFGFSTDFSKDTDRHRNWVIPFYYQGVDTQGESYRAVFPIGGTIHEFLGYDRIMFVLWPIYVRTQINDVKSTSIVWPIYSRAQGEKVNRKRVWPFYGQTELSGEFRKKFILWPFYTSVRYTNERNPGGGFILVPVYGRIETELASNYWFVAPFFRYMNSEEQWIVHAPWPFIQMADGIMHKRIVWPFYGKKNLGTLTRQYFLWPFIWNNKTEYARHDQRRRYVVPFFAHQTDVVTVKTGAFEVGDVSSRYWKIWPLISWERKHGTSRFRTLELWPLRNTPGVEKNWVQWWTLYRRENREGEIGHHLLWGLYRQWKNPERFEWSLLKGLAGYKKEQNSRRYRLFFMWFGGGEENP